MTEIKEKLQEAAVQAELAKETAEEHIADAKDSVEAAVDNAKQAVEDKVEDVAVQAELAKETAEEHIADAKDSVEAAVDNAAHAVEEKASGLKEKVTGLFDKLKK